MAKDRLRPQRLGAAAVASGAAAALVAPWGFAAPPVGGGPAAAAASPAPTATPPPAGAPPQGGPAAVAAAAAAILGPLAAATASRRAAKQVARAAEAGTDAALATTEEAPLATTEEAPLVKKATPEVSINPITGKPKKVKVLFDPRQQVGVVGEYFDPLGFSQAGQKGAFLRRRDVELKHGRVAMMAFTGLITQHFVHISVDSQVTFLKSSPYGIGAIAGFYGITGFGLLSIAVAAVGLLEFIFLPNAEKKDEPGNYGDPLGFGQYTREMRTAELQNGRFAMIGVTIALIIEAATGADAVEQLSAPLGFLTETLQPEPEGPVRIIPLTT